MYSPTIMTGISRHYCLRHTVEHHSCCRGFVARSQHWIHTGTMSPHSSNLVVIERGGFIKLRYVGIGSVGFVGVMVAKSASVGEFGGRRVGNGKASHGPQYSAMSYRPARLLTKGGLVT